MRVVPRRRKSKPLTRAGRVIAFIEKYCRVPEGSKVGEPIVLLPFQKKFIRAVYDNPAGTQRAYLSIARKNGKSALIACLVVVHLAGPEARQNSQIVCGARAIKQAGIIYALVEKMVELNPALGRVIRCMPSIKKMKGLAQNVEFVALAAEAKTAHGLSPVLAILDEVGQVSGPQDDFVDAIETSQGAHTDPLLIAISTQAPTDADLFSIWIDDAAASKDPHIVSHCYAAPVDAVLTDKRAWKAANPALGKFRSLVDVAEQAKRAARMASAENTFRNLTLNQRVTVFNPFVSRTTWMACAAAPDPQAFLDGEVWGGLDLSQTTDLTSLVLIATHAELVHVRPYFWMAADLVAVRSRADRVPYELWVKQGLLRTTPGKAIDYGHLAADIAKLCKGLNIRNIAFDRYRMELLKVHFDAAEVTLPLLDFGQGFVSMAPALTQLEIDLLHGRLRHGGHPVLNMCASNAVSVVNPVGDRKLDKSKSTGRIDGMVALAMARGAATMNTPLAQAEPQVFFL